MTPFTLPRHRSEQKDAVCSGWQKGISFGIGVWALTYLFYEVFIPLNQFGEPIPIVIYELGVWLVVALTEGVAIAAVTGPVETAPTEFV